MQGSIIDGHEPAFESIADGSYPVSRPLYVYIKNDHVGKIPGMQEFLKEYSSEDAMGEEGYLTDKGLIPLDEEMFRKVQDQVLNLKPLIL